MKMRMYWTYATRSLLRGGQRSLLAIFCVAVGVMAIVALQLVGNAINMGLTGNMLALNGGDVALSSPSAPITQGQLSTLDQLQAQGTITDYTAADELSGVVHAATGTQFFPLDAVDPERFPLDGAPVFTDPAGATLPSVLHGNTMVITTLLAQKLNLSLGSTLQLYTNDGRSPSVTVGGIIRDSGLFKGGLFLINVGDYAALPGAGPLTYTTLYADVPGHSDANARTAEQQLQSRFPLATIQTTSQALADNQTTVQEIQYFLQIVGLLALLIGGVGIVNTMQVLLRRRRVEIAMLKTAGYRRDDLYALFALEAALIGLIGGIAGALAGMGVSVVVTGLVEQTVQFALPSAIDPLTVLAGVVVGFTTALIFGLLPIVEASQIRPLSVLRELPTAGARRWKQALLSLALLALLGVLFFALALSILRNVAVAVLAVGGTAALLLLLGLLLGMVVVLIGKLPVPDALHWWSLPLVALALVGGVALAVAAPAFGLLCLLALVLIAGAGLLPRSWRATIKLALRNIARQKTRTVATLLALYIGVFSVGLIVVFGQNISNSINTFLSQGNGINAEIVATNTTRGAVEQQLAQTADIKSEIEAPFAMVVPVAIDGEPIAQFVQSATATGSYTASDVAGAFDGVQGYNLATGVVPDPVDVALTRGSHDAEIGRTLSTADAGTLNALLPVAASQAPDNLTLGATVTLAHAAAGPSGVASQAATAPVTVTVVGFYQSRLPQFGPVLTDSAAVNTLSGGSPEYGFRMHLDPAHVDQTLAQIQTAVPGITTYSLADFVGQFSQQLASLITVLVAVASLALLASIIIIANAVALAMLERRRELGVLKTLGHKSRSVLGEVLVENGVIGFTGGMLAMLVAAGAATALGKLAFNLPLSVPASTVLVVVLATAGVCMVVAASVAWGAVRVRPVEVLRYE